MNNLENTKITLNINKTLLKQFSDGLDRCFIKRDAFLNNLISIEIDKLDEEMKGIEQSKKARKYLIDNLKRSGTQGINVVVSKTVAKRLNAVIKKYGLSRDCFINRLLLLVTLPDGAKYELRMFASIQEIHEEVETSMSYASYNENVKMSTTTLDGIYSYISDPFQFLRICIYDDEPVNNLYKKSFYFPKFFEAIDEKAKEWIKEKKINPSELHDFKTMLKVSTCYIEDWELPNHHAYNKEMIHEKNNPPQKSLLESVLTKI